MHCVHCFSKYPKICYVVKTATKNFQVTLTLQPKKTGILYIFLPYYGGLPSPSENLN